MTAAFFKRSIYVFDIERLYDLAHYYVEKTKPLQIYHKVYVIQRNVSSTNSEASASEILKIKTCFLYTGIG